MYMLRDKHGQEVAPATLARQLYATGVVAFFLASLVTFGTSVGAQVGIPPQSLGDVPLAALWQGI